MACLFQRKSLALLGVVLWCSQPGCSSKNNERPAFRPGRAVYDTSAIDLTNFTTDPLTQGRVINMSFGEVAARLDSLQLIAESTFEFSHGRETHEQRDTYSALVDPEGNFHVRSATPLGQIEVFLVGENLYVRQDVGKLRQKARRDIDAVSWCELVHASTRQVLELFRSRLHFSDPTPQNIEGRSAVKYTLSLGPSREPFPQSTSTLLPLSPPAKWRELARPLDVQGAIWLDANTGVVLKSQVRGRLEIADRDVHPTQLTVTYQSAMQRIGAVQKIDVPASVPEYMRTPPPRDLLGFFSEHLPKPAPEEAKPPSGG